MCSHVLTAPGSRRMCFDNIMVATVCQRAQIHAVYCTLFYFLVVLGNCSFLLALGPVLSHTKLLALLDKYTKSAKHQAASQTTMMLPHVCSSSKNCMLCLYYHSYNYTDTIYSSVWRNLALVSLCCMQQKIKYLPLSILRLGTVL